MDDHALWQSLLANLTPEMTPNSLLSQHEEVFDLLNGFNSVSTAMFFGAMLTDPRYQANCVRLEALVHLSLVTNDGNDLPPLRSLSRCIAELGEGLCGLMEDPAEDVFVGNVITADGNFRVIEGLWESGSFYLQRFLDVLETTPDEPSFRILRQSTTAMLRLSDALCDRAGIVRYTLGTDYPHSELSEDELASIEKEIVFFSRIDLENMKISITDIGPFILPSAFREQISNIPMSRSPLQVFPLIDKDGGIAFVLPSAVSFSIRMYLTQQLMGAGYQTSVVKMLKRAYENVMASNTLFPFGPKSRFKFTEDLHPTAEALIPIDAGRFVHLLCVLDNLDEVKSTGIAGAIPASSILPSVIQQKVSAAITHSKSDREFRGGVTLLVVCGVGRSCVSQLPDLDARWSIQPISAPDLLTLAWTKDFTLLRLWKCLASIEALRTLGVDLINVNGFVNLVAWMESNDWQVLPHSQVPKGFREGPGVIQLPTNNLLKFRVDTAQRSDRVGIHGSNSGVVECRRLIESYFPGDDNTPIYVPVATHPKGKFPFVIVSAARSWWCDCTSGGSSPAALYERWLMLRTWMPRIIKAIEPYTDSMPPFVEIIADFPALANDGVPTRIPNEDDIRQSISADIDRQTGLVTMTAGLAFELGMQDVTNVSERILISELCKALFRLAEVELKEDVLCGIVRQIVPNDAARHVHAFQARHFRDFVASDLRGRIIENDALDSAVTRVGLAFRVESRAKGRFSTRSKRQSTRLLNSLVKHLETELVDCCRQFNRSQLLEMALINHERAIFSRERWMRTAKANLSIRQDASVAAAIITARDVELGSAIFSSLIIAEVALCEAFVDDGLRPGVLDFCRMQNLANAIAHLGGWSDAIHLDAMPPGLTLTALGDVQVDQQFNTQILMPFSTAASQDRIDYSMSLYSENFQAPPMDTARRVLDVEFENAWIEEFGFSIDEMRCAIDRLEEIGIERKSAVFSMKTSEFFQAIRNAVANANCFFDTFVLKSRESWRTIPEKCDTRDTQLWRYRRQISVVRRPILQLTAGDDALMLVAPGLVRQSAVYILEGYYEGTFPQRHYHSSRIKQWHGRRTNDRGRLFSEAVAEEFRNRGWHAQVEQDVNALVQCGKELDYGDVDVVAWNAPARKILIIECKHLYYGKTPGEIAEQLRDYRGRVRQDGRKQRRDDLRKHLDRIEIINERRHALCRTLSLPNDFQIEGWIVFKNPVPMLFGWKTFADRVQIATFDDISKIIAANPTC
jgi:hypothetical protein